MTPIEASAKAAEICALAPVIPVLVLDDLAHARPLAQRALAWSTNLWPVRQVLAPILRRQTAAKARPEHYPAPFALIEVWRRGGAAIDQRERERGLARSRRPFDQQSAPADRHGGNVGEDPATHRFAGSESWRQAPA